VWSRDVARKNVAEGEVALLIGQGKAETLEPRLKPLYREQLKASLESIDRGLEELGEIYVSEVRAVKAALAADPTRCVRIRTSPREKDPRYPALLVARLEVEQKGLGAVWGDFDRATREEFHVVVRWSEWPNLRNLIDCQVFHVHARNQTVRDWITRRYYENDGGAGMFDLDQQEGSRR